MKRAHAYSRAYLVWSTCTKHSYNHCELTTGVATGGHGWARAHPTSARVGREICTNSRTFFGGVGWGGFQTRMNLKVHRTYEHIICLCTVSCTFTFEYSDRVYSILQMYRVSKNSPPWGFLTFFSKQLGIFRSNFTSLLQVHTYHRIQIFIQLFATLLKLCHIKRDHPVLIESAKCPPSAETHAVNFWRFSKAIGNF